MCRSSWIQFSYENTRSYWFRTFQRRNVVSNICNALADIISILGKTNAILTTLPSKMFSFFFLRYWWIIRRWPLEGSLVKTAKKKTVKIGYFYINHGKLFFIFAKVSSFLPPIFGKKFVFFAGYCKNCWKIGKLKTFPNKLNGTMNYQGGWQCQLCSLAQKWFHFWDTQRFGGQEPNFTGWNKNILNISWEKWLWEEMKDFFL